MRPSTWFEALQQCQQQGTAYVLVTLLATAGSTPRDGGSKMLITDDTQYDTIGGGHLEFLITGQARQLLASGKEQQVLEHFPLASKLGQCCGGATNVLFEVMIAHGQHLAVFGAGHVAKALLPILAQLPLQISWVDERSELFPTEALPNNVKVIVSEDPVEALKALAESAWVVIMTHSHQLDYALVSAALARPEFDYIGMIGSLTKARRFHTKLSHHGHDPQQIQRLISPVGLTDIPGKKPIEVAVSIAAQVITRLNNNQTPALKKSKSQEQKDWLHSKQLTKLMAGSL
ncbi:MAG: xanthine dehydrogenase accessory factor [Paraglaciecola sp.]|jgi:xanthine dehydrogenase accessory factor